MFPFLYHTTIVLRGFTQETRNALITNGVPIDGVTIQLTRSQRVRKRMTRRPTRVQVSEVIVVERMLN